ncbi:MAG TPA: DUF1566 domain-containing protein [Polyangiaceae bacterium]|nr:DUF1566 domain-containing protein [Polyangiaceae bacterium]
MGRGLLGCITSVVVALLQCADTGTSSGSRGAGGSLSGAGGSSDTDASNGGSSMGGAGVGGTNDRGGAAGATNAGGTTSTGGAAGTRSTGGGGAAGTTSTGGAGGAAGTTSTGGAGGAAGTTSTGGAGGASGAAGRGGTITDASTGNDGLAGREGGTNVDAAVGSDVSSDSGGTTICGTPASCGTHRWACWPMPNPPTSGLPNPARYSDLPDGTVRDEVTCLIWQKQISASSYNVTDGKAYCAGLGTGWRMATRIELMSIMDFTQSAAKADPVAFPGTARAFFKSGSEWVLTTKQTGAGAGTDFGWAFNFSDGITSNARSGATADRVRCVRGGSDAELDAATGAIAVAPGNQYALLAAGEVQDNYTHLIWQQGYSAATMPWADAAAYCSTLALNGNTWRLPSIRELSTLVDEALVAPSINRTMFPSTKYGSRSINWYWASHSAAGNASAAWAINFDDGFTGFNAGATATDWNYFPTAWTRCVR